jgi:hypothetical protein
MSHPNPERRTNAPPGTRLLAGLTPEQSRAVTYATSASRSRILTL